MKKWKIWQIASFVVLCVLLNYGGRLLAARFDLPLWLDSLGTVLCAYAGGPVCGAIVGLCGNLIYGMKSHASAIYALTSVTLGLIVGFAARRGTMKTMIGTMYVATLAALAAITVSVPLNLLFNGGATGNLWGDGAIGFFRELGLPEALCCVLGQLYVDFADKLLTLLALRLIVHAKRRLFPRKAPSEGDATDSPSGPAAGALCLLVVLALCAGPCPAARAEDGADVIDYNDYVQTIYSSHNGLPCGEANDIVQTSDGILWIGTYAGLYRYNGREFRWMDGYDSVHNVNCLYVDEEGRLWIGTNDSGLSICIGEKIVNVVDQSGGLPSNSVRSIVQGTDGYYYIGTTGSMQILTLNNGLKRVSNLWEINHAEEICAGPGGLVAAISSDGRLFLMRRGQILSSIRLTGDQEIFHCCAFDDDGLLLAGTSANHIYVYDVSSGGFDELIARECEGLKGLNDLYYLNNGELFIAADNGVGYISIDKDFTAVNTNSFNNSIDNMLIDYQGNLWFTSSRLGLLRMAPSAFKDVYSTVGMSTRVVNAIVEWNGAYYFGTDKGLDVVDDACKRRLTTELTEALDGVRIRCLCVDSAGSLWICTHGGGLWEVEADGSRRQYTASDGLFGNFVRVAGELSDGTLLAAGDTGLSFIRDHAVVRSLGITDGLVNPRILTFTQLAGGKIYAGSDGDGIEIIENGALAGRITQADGLSSGVILRTVADPKSDGMFIVTSNSLCYMEPDGSVRKLDKFPYFNNYDIWARDEDTLFVMSSAGLYVVDRDELLSSAPGLSTDLLDSRRGLNSSLTANAWSWSDAKGDLFLPCDTGVFIIDSNRYSGAASTYRMTVNGVRLDSAYQRVDRSAPIRIGRGVSRIELYPEIINYTIQDPVAGYMLEGFDSDWTLLPQSQLGTVTYTNLPAGEYTFRLAVFDSSQENIVEEREYRVEKSKEIYDNRWFVAYILAVPMVAAAWFTVFIARRRVQRTLEKQAHELALANHKIKMGNQTILAIAKAVDAKDERTSQHSQRVSEYSAMIAREMGFSDEECENLRKAALMHDIGKISIPDNILNKPARLTDEEYATMKSHVTRGSDILKDFTLIDHVVDGARYHHERYDGRGYPDGLKGEEIPLYGRIIGVADAFDAMTANRVYRKQMDFDYVLNEMRKGRGTQFDPQIVDIMLKLIDDGKIDLNALYGTKAEAADEKSGG